MQQSTALPTIHANNAQNYVFVQARHEVMRLVPLRVSTAAQDINSILTDGFLLQTDEVRYQSSFIAQINPFFLALSRPFWSFRFPWLRHARL
jgi:hypothetical protein